MEEKGTRNWKGEMLVSTRKIWCNMKKYWLLGAGIMLLCAAAVGLLTFREYRADLYSAALDTYQGEALVYIDSGDEDYSDAYTALLYSERIRGQVDAALLENGFESFNKNLDTANVVAKGSSMCYRVIVRSIGLERTEFLAETYTELLLKEAEEVMKLKGEMIDGPVMTFYMAKADGSVAIFELDEPRTVALSLGSFLSWKKLMLLGAGFFLWCAFVMLKVFYDNTLRSREEMEQILTVPCLCEVRRKDQESYGLLAVLLNAVAERSGKEDVLLVGARASKGLTECFEELRKIAGEKGISAKFGVVEQAAVSAEALEAAKAASHVYLFAAEDEDDADSVDRALFNLQTVGADLEGYIAGVK